MENLKKTCLALARMGAADADMDALLEYTKNAFTIRKEGGNGELSAKWPEIWERMLSLCKTPPKLQMFTSKAGTIPIVYPNGRVDFETVLREIVYKGGAVPGIDEMGASFVHGKTLRFIILSDKPYSGVPAKEMGLTESDWAQKSMTIRKHHECAHYYTKRFYGVSRNNLHDELIADFCGLYAAFGEYRAGWFQKFFGIRSAIYTKGLSESAAGVIALLSAAAAQGVEAWSKTESFALLDEAERIEHLAGKGLLEYIELSNEI